MPLKTDRVDNLIMLHQRSILLSTDSVISIEDEEPEAADQSCPVCNKFFPAKQIENHVDKCLSSLERYANHSFIFKFSFYLHISDLTQFN